MSKIERTFPFDYSERIAIVEALGRGFAKVKHHEKWTQRVKAAFAAELPGYTVYVFTHDPGGFAGISVWGKGIHYDDMVSLSWCLPRSWTTNPKTWQESFAYDLDRQNPSDSAERQAAEAMLCPKLDKLEEQIEALRAQASALIGALPVPKSATLRNESHFWNSPSHLLGEKYPNLFGRVGR